MARPRYVVTVSEHGTGRVLGMVGPLQLEYLVEDGERLLASIDRREWAKPVTFTFSEPVGSREWAEQEDGRHTLGEP